MASWDFILNDEDRAVLEKSGYGARRGLGQKPAVLIVDAQYKFVGLDAPILASMTAYPISLGARAWQAVRRIEALLVAARARGVPVVYSTSGGPNLDPRYDSFRRKKFPRPKPTMAPPWPGDEIVASIAPLPGDTLVNKNYPSCFFGTPLQTYLNTLRVDTLIVVGFVTCGCVRSAVIDAFSYNYYLAVPEDAVADRMHISHYGTLLDLDMKYADVMSTADCITYLEGLPK